MDMEISPGPALLSGHDISKEFIVERKAVIGTPKKKFTAVNQVSFAIQAGETVGIVGESGSGKSTLGEILGGLRTPTQGAVYFDSLNILEMSESQHQDYRKNVQFIFQDPKGSMNPHFRIRDIIGEPLITLKICLDKNEIAQRVADMIKQVGLEEDTVDKYPGELSGGQCQRVAIARALIVRPKVIICDEPVSALDVSVQAQIMNLLKDLQRQYKIAYIFISHDIGVVNYMADRIVVMNKGSIVESGTAEQVFKSPVDEYTKKLVESSFSSIMLGEG
jgi:oligopeptide transport system ATP-binding protein